MVSELLQADIDGAFCQLSALLSRRSTQPEQQLKHTRQHLEPSPFFGNSKPVAAGGNCQTGGFNFSNHKKNKIGKYRKVIYQILSVYE
jgi:hypothetical protein